MGISSTGTRAFVFDYGGTLLHKEKVCRQLGEEREKGIRIRVRCRKNYEDEDGEDGDGRIWGEGNETEIINRWYENEKKIKIKE